MFKRLIIAVLALGLTMSLSSTAFSDVGHQLPSDAKYIPVNPNNPRVANFTKAGPQPIMPSGRVDDSPVLHSVPGNPSVAPHAPAVGCGYTAEHNGSLAFLWFLPEDLGGGTYMELPDVRFSAPAGETCTLKTASIAIYGPVVTGTPGMTVYLYDDDGFGFPGSLLDSVVFPHGSLGPAAGAYWADADFSGAGWVFEDGASYHYAIAPIYMPGDTLAYLSDNATGHAPATPPHNLVYLAGGGTDFWIPVSGVFVSGNDYGWFFESETCCAEIPFSDCYSQSYNAGLAYYWGAPDATYGDSAYAMRFSVSGPETLTSVDFRVYNATGGNPAAIGTSYLFGDDDLHVNVYDDDGFGLPGTQIASVTVSGGSYSAYPAITSASFAPLVLSSTFHVSLGSSAVWGSEDCEAFLSDNASSASGRGSTATDGNPDPWYTNLVWQGADVAWVMTANLCRDQFANCSFTVPYLGFSHVQGIPDASGYGNWRWGQKFTAAGGSNCEIREVEIVFAWASSDAVRAATQFTANTAIDIYTDAGGYPGTPIGGIVLTPADYAAMGNVGFTGSTYLFGGTIDFTPEHIQLVGNYWVVVEPLTHVRDSGIRVAMALTAGGAGYVGGGAIFSETFGDTWYLIDEFFGGIIADAALGVSAGVCCIPIEHRPCAGASDWPRYGGDDGSTGASQVAVGDSWCDLNYKWNYTELNSSAASVLGAGPIIFDGHVVSNFYDRYRKFNLGTGALEATWGPAAAGLSTALGSQLIGSGTVAVLPNSGDTLLFLGGGTNNNLVAVDWTTHTQTWGVAVGPNQGPVRGGAFMVLDVGGVDRLYYVTNSGNVVCRNANTGALIATFGAAGVTALGGNSSEITGVTDGTDLYFSTDPIAPANGSIFKINGTTGAIIWSIAAVDLKGTLAYLGAAVTRETFNGGIAIADGFVYANSTIPNGSGNYPSDGVFYKVNAGTGAIAGYSQSEALFPGTPLRSHPVIHTSDVIVPVGSRWGGGTLFGAAAIAFTQSFATIDWAYVHPEGVAGTAAALACDTGMPDQLFVTMAGGWLGVVNSNDGDEIYRRRWDLLGAAGVSSYARGVAIGNGPYVALTSRTQYLMVLDKGGDRPRLEIETYNPLTSVEFGSNPALPVDFGPLITNTGCDVLNIEATAVDANPFVPRIPTFSIEDNPNTPSMSRSTGIADMLTMNSFSAKGHREVSDDPDMMEALGITVSSSLNREIRNHAASAPPAWYVSTVHPIGGDVLNPGDTMNLVVLVDQNMISRGPQSAYMQINSDDPDFFLNDTSASPQIIMTIVGGCLSDTTDLHFGIGAANTQHVWNHGRLGDGDVEPSHGFDIDGDEAVYFQGSYVLALTQRRWAVHVPDWFSNVTDELISLQADPNWCDSTCKPALTSPYNVGSISSDGLTYTPIDANMICRSYLDSVQNFFDAGDADQWDVTLYHTAPFDNDSTMGLYVRSRFVGAVDEPGLTNVTVDLMSVTERNGRDLDGFFWGSMNDYDLGNDTIGLDQSVSVAYDWDKTGGAGCWGQIKLPFGCGQEPMRNTKGLEYSQGFGAQSGQGLNAYFDTMYTMMQAPSGSITTQPAPNASDFDQHMTYFGRDIAANEVFEFGVAHFGLPAASNASTSTTNAPAEVKTLARLVNKWTGWGRGDVNDDNLINLADIVYLAANVHFGGPGPIPFAHLGDVDASGGAADAADVTYLINYYFNCGPCPAGEFVF